MIRHSRGRYGVLACPHTATALRVLERLRDTGDSRNYAIVATAHPAKFDAVIEPLIGIPIAIPAGLAMLLERPAHAEPLAAHYAALCGRLSTMA